MNNITKKIKSKSEIEKIAKELHKNGKTIATCNGSFDLLHWGHIQFLTKAKGQADVLIVGLNSDESIHKYKSLDRPIIGEKFRAESLAALECTNYIVLMNEAEIAIPLIEMVKPNVHVNGAEYGKNCIEAKALAKIRAKLYMIPKLEGFSTTDIIKKIIIIYSKENKNNIKKENKR